MTVIPSQFGILSNLLDAAELRQRVISQNIANVNTPGYHRQDVAFEEALTRQLIQGGKLDAGGQRPDIYEVEGLPLRADGNNVDIDKEMGQLNKNALLYQTYAQVLASKMAMMRSAMTGQ